MGFGGAYAAAMLSCVYGRTGRLDRLGRQDVASALWQKRIVCLQRCSTIPDVFAVLARGYNCCCEFSTRTLVTKYSMFRNHRAFSLKISDYFLVIAKEDRRDDCAFGTEEVGGNF